MMAAALLTVVMSSSGAAFGAAGDPGLGNVAVGRRAAAEPRLFVPFDADISANIQNGKNAMGSPQNSLTFLVNVIIAVGRPVFL